MKTFMLRKEDVEHKWYVIDAEGKTLGKVAEKAACVLRGTEIGAEVILMAKNGTDGVYDSDPKKNPDAKLYKEISFSEILAKNLKVMDSTAASLCKENKLEIIVFNMNKDGNIVKAVNGEKIGTHVTVD